MTDLIFMSPKNAKLCVAVPLYRRQDREVMYSGINTYTVTLVQDDGPIAYLLDIGESAHVVSADWVHENLILLGPL
jgi:hypothetical protein